MISKYKLRAATDFLTMLVFANKGSAYIGHSCARTASLILMALDNEIAQT